MHIERVPQDGRDHVIMTVVCEYGHLVEQYLDSIDEKYPFYCGDCEEDLRRTGKYPWQIYTQVVKGTYMTWSLNAHGAVDPGLTDEQAKKLEADLATALHEVLSRPEFGTQHSTLGSRWWQGRVHISHEPPPAPQSAPEPNPADMPPITNGGPGYEPQDGPTSSEPTAAAPTAGQQEAAN